MHLVNVLASGVAGAANGTAEIYARGTATRVSYYQDFEGTSLINGAVDVQLDSYGRALVYVSRLVKVVVKNSAGVAIFADGFVAGDNDNAVEVVSPSFTGNSYATGGEAVNQPTTLAAVLDAWTESGGAPDWQVLVDGSATPLEEAIATIAGYFENVKASGALGDGSEDDTSAVQAALDAAAASGRLVFFPPGTFRVTANLTWPPGVSALGCGPEKSILGIDHASTDLISCAADTETQQANGLAFVALQAHSGSLIEITSSGNFFFSGCSFGNAFSVPAIDDGLIRLSVDGIDPQMHFSNCLFRLGAAFVGTMVSKDSDALGRLLLSNCRAVLLGDCSSGFALFRAGRIIASGCLFDSTLATVTSAGSVNWLNPTMPALAEASLAASGNEVPNSGGATVSFILSATTDIVAEAGNRIGTSVGLLTGTGVSRYSSLSSRRGRVYEVTQSTTAALVLSALVLSYDAIVITLANNSSFTITMDPGPCEGLEVEFFVVNAAGGASGTFTWNAAHFAGLSSVTGTAPPTTMAANGTFVSVRFRSYDGPDGVRWYPVGGAYAGT